MSAALNPALSARIMLVAGVTLGGLLVAFGLWRVTHPGAHADRGGAHAPASVSVVVASHAIPRGARIAAEDLAAMSIAAPAPAELATSPAAVIGRTASVDIPAHQLILTSAVSSQPATAGLAALVPVGYRAITVNATDELSIGRALRPGDLVDVHLVLPTSAISRNATPDASESRLILQDIQVLAADADTPSQNDGRPAGAPRTQTLTLAMTPDQVSKFILARTVGHFYVVLRNPTDQAPAPEPRLHLADIRGLPPAGAPGARRHHGPAPIELVVQGRRETLYPHASAQ